LDEEQKKELETKELETKELETKELEKWKEVFDEVKEDD